MSCQILHGDCRKMLLTIGDATIDAIITDPPYELGFMGKRWDATGIAYDLTVWAECLRVLKPGGHLLAFGGTRTYHRMACAIEDAGFEIRDSIHWLYGSGFPKSLDVSKAIDKRGGNAHLAKQIGAALKAARQSRNIGITEADRRYCGGVTLWSWYEGRPAGQQMPTAAVMRAIAADWPEMQPYANLIDEAEREVVGSADSTLLAVAPGEGRDRPLVTLDMTAPATDAARQWEGWGTALKPAHEPIIVARKPLDGTVAANVLAYGTGALNIDGCRIEGDVPVVPQPVFGTKDGVLGFGSGTGRNGQMSAQGVGRWPANVVIDQHIADQHPEWANYYYCPKASTAERNTGLNGLPEQMRLTMSGGHWVDQNGVVKNRPQPSANTHPTVKPLDLMRWLCRLVTPPDGTILDPFAGSGTTLTAAILEHFNTIGIELTDEYHPIIQARTSWAQTHIDSQLPL